MPRRAADRFSGLPPAYSFVGDGEPFYAETVRYFEQLRAAGIPAELDVYHTDLHAFDMLEPSAALSGRQRANFMRTLPLRRPASSRRSLANKPF